MIEINSWVEHFSKQLSKTFGERVWFIGLQGSYGRGEATETSDIDLVVILDELSAGQLSVRKGVQYGVVSTDIRGG